MKHAVATADAVVLACSRHWPAAPYWTPAALTVQVNKPSAAMNQNTYRLSF